MFITVFSTCYTVTCQRNFWTCINMFIKLFLGVCRMFGMWLTHVVLVFVQILDTSTFLRIDFTCIYPCLALFGKVWHKFGMSLALISYFYLNVIMTFAFSLNLRWVLSSPTLTYVDVSIFTYGKWFFITLPWIPDPEFDICCC